MYFLKLALLCAFLCGCAAAVTSEPVRFSAAASSAAPIRLARAATIKLPTGYTRELPAGSRWTAVGSVAQGTVYSPVGTVFTIEGRNVHEAYLVLKGASLQGFYLPGEGSYSPLASSIPLTLGD